MATYCYLINARGLAGTGMWTLLMDQGRDELWRLLADKFVRDTQAPVGGVDLLPGTTDTEAFVVRWRAQDYASGVSHYNVQYRLIGGAWHGWLSGTRRPLPGSPARLARDTSSAYAPTT